MRESGEALYLDSSALVKLVVQEPESGLLARFLDQRPVRVTCALARVEVVRAVRAQGPAAVARARHLLERLHVIRMDDELLDAAGELEPWALRSLDAIHLAAARALGEALGQVVTYDSRMAGAARSLGMRVVAPGVVGGPPAAGAT